MYLIALAALQAASALKQADEITMAAELNNQLSEVNAKYAEYDAYTAERFGFTESAAYQKNIDEVLGGQRAGYASQGVDIGYGTAAEVQNETKLTGALNIIDIQNQATMKAQGYLHQARNIRQGMSVAKSQAEIQANTVGTAGILNAAGTGYRGYTQMSPDGLKKTVEGTSNKSSGRLADNSTNNYNGRVNFSGQWGYGPGVRPPWKDDVFGS